MYCIFLITSILLVRPSWTIEAGDACLINKNESGVCKYVEECPYAVQLLTVEEKKPSMCRWDGSRRIVCCPLEDKSHTIGEFRSYFNATKKGVLRSPYVTCRYSGNLPILCCKNTPESPPTPEPLGCPPLQLPKLPRRDIIWRKCLEYQRYFNVCETNDAGKYQRVDTCGIMDISDRIVGGTPAYPKEFPHMALLGVRNTKDPEKGYIRWVGGATLISDRFLLTAAHMIAHRDYGSTQYALLGVINRTKTSDGLLYNIVNAIPYKLYQKNEKMHDIALMELDRQVRFSEFVRPACLPMVGLHTTGEKIVAGWGKTDDNRPMSTLLTKATIKELNYERECKSRLPSNMKWDPKTMLCAAGEKNENTCQGDSGGPLMELLTILNCTYIVTGVTSWGPGCSNQPGVYTNVANDEYMNWIVNTVWPNQ